MTLYQVDAFADKIFSGNPAAVVPLEKWIDEQLMQDLAMENNLAETVFFVPEGTGFKIRWFTPVAEINLCGHATLASAYVLFNFLGYDKPTIVFYSKSGPLHITRHGEQILMDFPSWKPERMAEYPNGLQKALGVNEIAGVYRHRDLLVELNAEEDVRKAQPDFTLIKNAGEKIIITAPGDNVDFVSRFFAPTLGVDEDPVTGSAHSQLIPFWSEKLAKKKMIARQLSKRGGEILCEHLGDRVTMAGSCVLYMQGEIQGM